MPILRPLDPGALAERALALSYAPAEARPALTALFALDDRLGAIVATTTEPLLGQMRLTWWHDAVAVLDRAAPPAEPTLAALAEHIVPRVPASELAEMVAGWEVLLAEDRGEQLAAFAAERGARLFAIAAQLLGVAVPDVAGRGWALADLGGRAVEPDLARVAGEMAKPLVDAALGKRWPRDARCLGALVHLARMNLAARPPRHGAPRRIARLAWHRLTGG